MALDFPNSPTNGQLYTDPVNGNRYVYDSANSAWKSTSTFQYNATVSSTAPGTPQQGSLWWNQDYGRLLVYYQDANTSQWVDATPSMDYRSDIFAVANASFGKANTALQNTSGTFAGNLGVAGSVTATGSFVAGSARTIPSTGGLFFDVTGINNDIVANGRTAAITAGWGSLRVHQNATFPGLKLVGDTSQTANYMEVESSTGSTLYAISANGRVGIGTSAPGARLDVGDLTTANTPMSILARPSGGDGNFILTASSGQGTTVSSEFCRFGLKYGTANTNHNAGIGFWRGGDVTGGWMTFHTNDWSERMRIDSSGRVTMPYQPAVHATLGTTHGSSGAGSVSRVVFNAVQLNRGSHYNTGTGYFTCPVAGVYRVTYFGMSQTALADGIFASVFGYPAKNDTGYGALAYNYGDGYRHISGSWLISCAVNDTLSMYVNDSYAGYNGMTIELVG